MHHTPRVLVASLALAVGLMGTAGADSSTQKVLFTDPAGDATGFVVASTPLPSQPSLDLITGLVDYDLDAKVLTFVVEVADLTGTPAVGAVGNTYYVNFEVKGTRFFVTATDHVVEGQSFRYGDFGGANAGRRTLGDITGAFDYEADTVTFDVPAATLGVALTPGTSIGSDLLAQRYVGVSQAGGATPTADLALGNTYRIPFPDADGDGVRSDVDCDDNDPTISEGC